MEGLAQLLTLVPVMWVGQECSVKEVSDMTIEYKLQYSPLI